MKYISLAIGEKIIEMLDESGASEAEKYAALDVARAVVPVSANSISSKNREEEEAK